MIKVGLHVRLSALAAIITSVFALASAYFIYVYSYDKEYSASLRTIDQLISTVDQTASIAAYSHNTEIAKDMAKGLLSNDLVQQVIFKTDQIDIEMGDNERLTSVPITRNLQSPFDELELVIGQLAIYPKMPLIHKKARAVSTQSVAIFAAFIFLLTMIILLLVWFLVTRPVKKVATVLQDMSLSSGKEMQVPQYLKGTELDTLLTEFKVLISRANLQLENERKLRDQVESIAANFRMVFELSGNAVAVTDGQFHLLNHNPAFQELMALAHGSLPDKEQWIKQLFKNPEEFQYIINSYHKHPGRSVDMKLNDQYIGRRWASVQIQEALSDQGSVIYLVFIQDVTRHQEALAASQYEAGHDVLTGLKNRRHGSELIEQKLHSRRDNDTGMAVFVVDLDGFKAINDTQGLEAGDQILIDVSRRLENCSRESDVVVRWGGDEFVVTMMLNSPEDALKIAEKIRHSIQEPIQTGSGRTATVGASIGISMAPQHGEEFSDLFKKADMSMYHIKQQGKNGVKLYDKSVSEELKQL